MGEEEWAKRVSEMKGNPRVLITEWDREEICSSTLERRRAEGVQEMEKHRES